VLDWLKGYDPANMELAKVLLEQARRINWNEEK
jgi:hypothetical protein